MRRGLAGFVRAVALEAVTLGATVAGGAEVALAGEQSASHTVGVKKALRQVGRRVVVCGGGGGGVCVVVVGVGGWGGWGGWGGDLSRLDLTYRADLKPARLVHAFRRRKSWQPWLAAATLVWFRGNQQGMVGGTEAWFLADVTCSLCCWLTPNCPPSAHFLQASAHLRSSASGPRTAASAAATAVRTALLGVRNTLDREHTLERRLNS